MSWLVVKTAFKLKTARLLLEDVF